MTKQQQPMYSGVDEREAMARDRLADRFTSHSDAILQFSGGKDSLACLELVRPWLNRVLVLWVNAGDELPETRQAMERVRATVPHFFEVRGNALEEQQAFGWPVDMLPQEARADGRFVNPGADKPPMMRLRYDCCAANRWAPMAEAVKATNIKLVIRGGRSDDWRRVPGVADGFVEDGVTYALPLFDWTKADVFEYLAAHGVDLPRTYAYGVDSVDCMHCTSYLKDGAGHLKYLRDFHPSSAVEFERRLIAIHEVQERELRSVRDVLCQFATERND